MKLRVASYRPEDLSEMVADAIGQRGLAWHDRRKLEAQFGGEYVRGFTVRDAEGRVLLCGGSIERHPQYASLWAVHAEGIGRKQWGQLLNMTRHFISGLPHRRVDAMVEAEAAMAVRWAEACGLEREAVLAQAAPDGGDMVVMILNQEAGQ